MKKRIVILFHEFQYDRSSTYMIDELAEIWREEGLEVIELYGLDRFVPADIVILHIDLSVVPPEYLEFTRQYPVALNTRLTDIRKVTISQNLIKPGDPYGGPVIVKSNLNYAGAPERKLKEAQLRQSPFWLKRLQHRIFPFLKKLPVFQSNLEYQIFDRVEDVPNSLFNHPDVVVEKFFQCRHEEFYCIHNLYIFGNLRTGIRLAGHHPIVNGRTYQRIDFIDPDSEVLEQLADIPLDYGKIDYVFHDGKVVIIDINKTIGDSRKVFQRTPELIRFYKKLAAGIHVYLG
ncbi:MAG TPA: hypothetical protein PLL06_18945 [Acidobacteriota bacterium]|nr:hypothetical protein [Acidobacteriota bacterium]HMZ81781.1 hypothetical protein [Acidobacteriota bacterium]HND20959.1 hypothetical protein [Acidobacteriota bacterium]HNG93971.1 hypothetical protein [Acidobacteriota bacterium]HNJ40571.1 hypothetical protein [Acidobacteriota bacterium]